MAEIYRSVVAERRDALVASTGFEWDEANGPKHRDLHRVTPEEAEDIFFNEPQIVRSDLEHSKREKRYYALRWTSAGRDLFVTFTVRGSLLRVICAREMNRREKDA